jgi:hypothetical protein
MDLGRIMSKRAKRGKTKTIALPLAGRVAIGAMAVAAGAYQFAVSACERSTDTEAVRAPGPATVNSS